MNSELLKHEDFGEIRMKEAGNDMWFAATDICRALEMKQNVTNALQKLDDDEKGVETFNTLGGNQKMLVVNESGLYHLIFNSYKPAAKKFRKWVTSEVLPSIRKTGSYDGLAEKVAEPKVSMWVSKEKKEDFLASIIKITNQKERVAVYENWMRYRESISVQLNH